MKSNPEQPLIITETTSSPNITRRHFVKRAGAATATTMFALHVLREETRAADPNSPQIYGATITITGPKHIDANPGGSSGNTPEGQGIAIINMLQPAHNETNPLKIDFFLPRILPPPQT